ncbi:TRAP transporter large permease [Arthrobacter sp. 3Tela_A]|uniref:TRAP transporter large permease n=1 Tax=Arthrobacter sp. 3Tela_A TaxID=3093743 RepID=UPI003BB72D8B
MTITAEKRNRRRVVSAGHPGLQAGRGPTWVIWALIAAAIVTIALMWVVPEREMIGGLAVVLMLILMFMKVPIAFALAIPGLLGLFTINGWRAVENLLTGAPYTAISNWSLSVLPMFILMGMLLGSSGITTRAYTAARLWLGWLPGGLAIGTNVAGAGLAAVSGSTIGITYALGRVGIPEMLKRQYDPKLAIGSVVMAGLPGQLIPPSTFLIIVAGITGAAVGPQLIAGVLPGIALVLVVCVSILIYALIKPRWAGRAPEQRATAKAADPTEYTFLDRVRSLGGVWPIAVLMIAIFGAMFGGVLTATEAGALGAFVAVLLTLWFRRGDKPFGYIVEGAAQTVLSVGAIFFILIGATILSHMVAVTRLGALFSDMILSLGLGRVGFLLVVMGIYIILGMFMDPLAILLLTIPVLQPSFEVLGIDVLWFGVFAVLMGELAILTPPVGMLTFIVHKMVQAKEVNLGQRISLKDVFMAVGLFFPAIIVLTMLMIFFPDFVTWLPSLM